ncbi:heterokaryon incompatibility protein-domain-containing protein [Xylaria sp. FL0933]|nr:heterokaryon incompatibility protein-domain-containing protein [Xylaria sp. FL0933]
MRLLNVKTRQLQDFFGEGVPDYAILSHTWGEEEVTFQDLQYPSHKKKRGYTKIHQTCLLAAIDRLKWIWIDACCIDKSSSAELSEAINSMFDWYQRAAVCYVYLGDVPPSKPGEDIEKAFSRARWLTRGWTLQEFLAASPIRLFDSAWQKIEPSNFPIRYMVSRIDKDTWKTTDVPTRLSWAASRQTSRQEDMAYCLLGLLGINMPLLYGEGSSAFPRLLEELIKKSNSHGLLASWYGLTPLNCGLPLLPRSPFAYAGCTNGFQEIPVAGKPTSRHFSLTNAGLHIELPLSTRG